MDLLFTQIAKDDTTEYNNYDILGGFLLQFDAFIKEEMLLKKIKSVFNYYVNFKKHLPRSLIVFLSLWILLKWKEDFFENVKMVKEMKSFYLEINKFPEVKDDKELKIEELIELLDQDNKGEAEFMLQNLKDRKKSKNISMKIETLLPYRSTEYFDILAWPELEIARQISLYTHYYFSKIELKEILSTRWTKKTNYIDE